MVDCTTTAEKVRGTFRLERQTPLQANIFTNERLYKRTPLQLNTFAGERLYKRKHLAFNNSSIYNSKVSPSVIIFGIDIFKFMIANHRTDAVAYFNSAD